MMKQYIFLLAAFVAIFPSTAMARSTAERMVEDRFRAADANMDGKLTKAEAQAGMPRIHANFDRIDSAKRGYLTLAQVKAVVAAASR